MTIIRETKYWEVLLHENQYYLGYSVLVLKRKCQHLSNLKNEEQLETTKKYPYSPGEI